MASLSRKRQSHFEEKLAVVEQFEFVHDRIEDLIRHAKGLVSLLKKRVQVEKDHLKAMQKLAQGVHEDTHLRQVKFEGELDYQWSEISSTLLSEALFISNFSSTLESQALQPLTVHMLSDLDKRFRSTVAEGRKVIRDYQFAKTAAMKAKDKYFSATAEWEVCLLALYAEGGGSWAPAPGNKLYEKEQITSKKSSELRAEYELASEKANQIQNGLHSQQMPEVLLNLNNVALNMVTVVHSAMNTFSSCQALVLVHDKKRSLSLNDDFNVSEYTYRVLFGGQSSESFPSPLPFEFQEYNMKDEAIIVSTRKVQYRAMSQLSPAELAVRGQQFINEMDRKSQQSSRSELSIPTQSVSIGSLSDPSSSSALSLGMNPDLVCMCVEYLHKPLALREEGLFRVSGDNNLMRTMHKDFQCGTIGREDLKTAVMEQRDPNTVSGLLKLHLRENYLLSMDTISAVVPHLEAKDTSEVLDTLLQSMPSLNLRLLVQIISLMAVIVSDPWKTENKMNPRNLGIACGLSLFPQLDPGKATFLLEMLIKNIETLKENQTIL